jgi:hypothetical protein
MQIFPMYHISTTTRNTPFLLLRRHHILPVPRALRPWWSGEKIFGTTLPCDPASGEGELGFLEVPRVTGSDLHDDWSSIQVWRCYVPSSPPSAMTRLYQCHQQQYYMC